MIKKRASVRQILNKLQELEKKLGEFETNNAKEHQELRNLISGLGKVDEKGK